jgi:very-short-patch-repair endonuclease
MEPFFARYTAGEGSVKLAREIGIHPERFKRLLVAAGYTARTIGEAVGLRYTVMSQGERGSLTANANVAKRGRPASERSLERRARTMQATLQLASRADLALALWLAQRGVRLVVQQAVGPYNIDIAIHERAVAVEVNGAYHDARLRALSRSRTTPEERLSYLLDRGWRVIDVNILGANAKYLRPACADRIVALLEGAGPTEADWGQHCVIGGDGEPLA